VEIPDEIKNRLEIHPVRWIEQVLTYSLERQPMPMVDKPSAEPAAVPAVPAEEEPTVVIKH